MDTTSWITQLRKGVVEYILLVTLSQGEAYGYEILQTLSKFRHLSLGESTVYPILNRLSRDGCLAVRRVKSQSGPPRRYYRLTAAGKRKLDEMDSCWCELNSSITEIKEEKSS